MTHLDFIRRLESFSELAWEVYPDQWNHVCSLRGIDVETAQNLYGIFQYFAKGIYGSAWIKRKVDDETIQTVFEIVDEVRSRRNNDVKLNVRLHGFGNNQTNVAVYWQAGNSEDGTLQEDIHREELNLTFTETYCFIADLLRNRHTVLGLVYQIDEISDTSSYRGRDLPENDKSLKVFDGDVFCIYNKKESDCFSHPYENGLYIATTEGYRRLLYTPGKGYVRKGEPDMDDEELLDFADGFFTHFKITMDHCWRRVGNVNINADFLKEK